MDHLSESQRRMMLVVERFGFRGVTARDAAKAMWPQSESWSHSVRRGRRMVFGQGAQMRAGVMLHELHQAGMIARAGRDKWRLSPAGHDYLHAGQLAL